MVKDESINVYKYASTNEETALEKIEKLKLGTNENAGDGVVYSIMGHNRWATHGIKNDTNAHPHLSNSKKFAIVHNGIIENYNE